MMPMKFYDLHVRGVAGTVENLAKQAGLLGYAGIAVFDVWQNEQKFAELKKEIEAVNSKNNMSPIQEHDGENKIAPLQGPGEQYKMTPAQKSGEQSKITPLQEHDEQYKMTPAQKHDEQLKPEIFLGIEIQPKTSAELLQLLDTVAGKATIVAISSPNFEVSRAACGDARVDMIIQQDLDRRDIGFDDDCAAAAAQHGTALALDFHQVLYTFRRQRAAILQKFSTLVEIAGRKKMPVIIVSGARSAWDMRDPRELVALGNVLGPEIARCFTMLSDVPATILEKGKKRLSDMSPLQGRDGEKSGNENKIAPVQGPDEQLRRNELLEDGSEI